MPETLEGLRSQIRQSRCEKRFGAIRYSLDLRERILTHARSEMADGRKLRDVARSLDIATETIKRWLLPVESTKSLRSVIVAENQIDSRYVIISPAGYRVEGLSAEDVTRILGALG